VRARARVVAGACGVLVRLGALLSVAAGAGFASVLLGARAHAHVHAKPPRRHTHTHTHTERSAERLMAALQLGSACLALAAAEAAAGRPGGNEAAAAALRHAVVQLRWVLGVGDADVARLSSIGGGGGGGVEVSAALRVLSRVPACACCWRRPQPLAASHVADIPSCRALLPPTHAHTHTPHTHPTHTHTHTPTPACPAGASGWAAG
jgi:hypothetical protein